MPTATKPRSKKPSITSQHTATGNGSSKPLTVSLVESNHSSSVFNVPSNVRASQGRWMSGALSPGSVVPRPSLDSLAHVSFSKTSTKQSSQLSPPTETKRCATEPHNLSKWLSHLDSSSGLSISKVQTISSSAGDASGRRRTDSKLGAASTSIVPETTDPWNRRGRNDLQSISQTSAVEDLVRPSVSHAPSSVYHPPTVESVRSSSSSQTHIVDKSRSHTSSTRAAVGSSWLKHDDFGEAINEWRTTSTKQIDSEETDGPWKSLTKARSLSSGASKRSVGTFDIGAANIPLPSSRTTASSGLMESYHSWRL